MPHCKELANGVSLLLIPCEAESVAVGVFVASGSRHEPDALSGISHFIEHMLFKGTSSRRQIDITRAIEGKGGNFNAYTSEEATCYYVHMPNECLATAVDILADMYHNASFDEDEFKREKEVVIEEIRMYQDDPDSVALENLQRNLFPENRLGVPVAGSEKTLRPLRATDLKHYLKSHYLPRATTVVVVGAFEEEKAIKLVERSFT